MRKRLSIFALPVLAALAMGVASTAPANAGAVSPPNVAGPAAKSDVVKADWRRHGGRRHFRGHHRGRPHIRGRSHYRPYHRRYYRGPRSGIFLNFGAPAVVRPRYVNPGYRGLSSAHVRWCYSRYRSYRAADNTFQPYHGPRRQCNSPYR